MKRITALFFAIITISVFAQQKNEIRKIGSFDKIIISNGIEATLIQSDKDSISISVVDGLPEDVIEVIKGSTLEMRLKTTRINKTKAKITISYQSLKEIEANSNSRVTVQKVVKNENIKVSANTGAIINLAVECNELTLSASENSQIIVSGSCKTLEAKSTTGATVGAAGLACETAVVKASIKAYADFRSTQKAEIYSNTGAEVTIYGRTKEVTTKTGLGGKVFEKPDVDTKVRPISNNMIDTLSSVKN